MTRIVGNETVSFEYNEDGLRTKKTVTNGEGTVVTEYVLHGKNIVHMTRGIDEMHFFYGADNKPAIVVFNGTSYRYLYTLQGDVIGLVDGNGAWVVAYRFDAWGKPLGIGGSMANTLGVLQPFRYRGYVFDEETGDYYLRSRYYRPEWCRFVSADALIKGSLYVYCNNQPTLYIDLSGHDGYHIQNPGYDFEIFDEMLCEEHEIFIATICGEAIGESVESWVAVAWVIRNRYGHHEWAKYDSITEVIQESGFDGYGGKQYNKCMEYLHNRDGSNELYERVISAVMPVYFMDISDPTSFATLFYSPRLNEEPPRYIKNPRVVEVTIEGVDSDIFRFFRYIEDDDPFDIDRLNW